MAFKKSSPKEPQPQSPKTPQQDAPPTRVGPGGRQSRPDPDQVARRAYERFVQRGGQHGHDQEDWIEAEKELGGRGRE